MKVNVVVDVGNSRIKWGLCQEDAVTESIAFSASDPNSWQQVLQTWNLPPGASWAVGGVNPQCCTLVVDWLRQQEFAVWLLHSHRQLPLQVLLEQPESVGIDRLLNAVAVNSRRKSGMAAIAVDAGSAVTVDYVDENGCFHGGAIFPGLWLMAKALHDYTALLPLIEVRQPLSQPGKSTDEAMELGLLHAVVGGIEALIQTYQLAYGTQPEVFLGGGDGPFLARALHRQVSLWPSMTLEGIRLAAVGEW